MTKSGGGSIAFIGSAITYSDHANHDMMAAAKGAVAGEKFDQLACESAYRLQAFT
jgi:hypothetical protein